MELREILFEATNIRDKDGQPMVALSLLKKYSRRIGDSDEEWVSYLMLKAVLSRDTGDIKAALIYYREALKLTNQQNLEIRADILRSMAFISIHTTGVEDALKLAMEAVSLLKGTADGDYLRVKANCHAVLGNVYYVSGRLGDALVAYNLALDYAYKSNFPERVITLIGDMANVYVSQKEYNKALALLTKWIGKAESTYRISLPQYYLRRAKVYLETGNNEKSLSDIQMSIDISSQEGWLRDLGESYEALGDLYLATGGGEANAFFRKALAEYRKGKFKELIHRVKRKLG